jgi:hypothetical protein
VWRGGLGGAYLLPTLSSVGASLATPCFRFHTPLIEPDVRICRIRLSEKTHAIAGVARNRGIFRTATGLNMRSTALPLRGCSFSRSR